MKKHSNPFDFKSANTEEIVYFLLAAIRDEPEKVVENLDGFLFEREKDATVTTFRYAACHEIMKADALRQKPFFAEIIRERWRTTFNDFNLAFSVGAELSKIHPDLFCDETESLAMTMLENRRNRSLFLANWHPSMSINLSYFRQELENSTLNVTSKATNWLIAQFGAKHLDRIGQACVTWLSPEDVLETIDNAVDQLQKQARPLILKIMERGDSQYDLFLLKHLIAIGEPANEEIILTLLGNILNDPKIETKRLVEALELAKRFRPVVFYEQFLKYVSHTSKPVRELAAELLGRFGDFDSIYPLAARMLEDKKADTRCCGALILDGLYEKTRASDCLQCLEKRFQIETSDEVRDRIAVTLIPAWKARQRSVSLDEIQSWCKASQRSIKSVPWGWIDFEELPPLEMDGRKLDRDMVKYLMVRQSRSKGISIDPEAGVLLEMIDRRSSGDFAFDLLESFLDSGMKAENRWAMTLACLLGDDRLVASLAEQACVWTESARHKMGEYAVEALALLGTDAALCIVHSMILRYRTRRPNVSAVAKKIMSVCAEEQGISLDELGERLVPNLDFEPGKPKTVECGPKTFHVFIGPDFRPNLIDKKTGKMVSSFPKSAPKSAKREFNAIRDSIVVISVAQRDRLEDLMLREYRWTVSEWFQKYPFHPILKIFASKIVWGQYDQQGRLKGTFRLLDDGTATDLDDNTVMPPKSGSIGIVHPVELDRKAILGWKKHFSDYDVLSVFPQLERKPFTVSPEETGKKTMSRWQGCEIFTDLFLKRAEKSHWSCPLYSCNYMVKTLSEIGMVAVVAFQELSSIPGPEDKTSFGIVYFAKVEKRDENDYAPYPLPDRDRIWEDDPRILKLDQVPRIAFSEILAELDGMAIC